MALFLVYGHSLSSSSTRICMLALITLVFVCSIPSCSSSPTYLFGAPTVENGDDNVAIDKNSYGQDHRPDRSALPALSSVHGTNTGEHPIALNDRYANLLSKAALLQGDDRIHRLHQIHANNRRYAAQAFHAMRG